MKPWLPQTTLRPQEPSPARVPSPPPACRRGGMSCPRTWCGRTPGTQESWAQAPVFRTALHVHWLEHHFFPAAWGSSDEGRPLEELLRLILASLCLGNYFFHTRGSVLCASPFPRGLPHASYFLLLYAIILHSGVRYLYTSPNALDLCSFPFWMNSRAHHYTNHPVTPFGWLLFISLMYHCDQMIIAVSRGGYHTRAFFVSHK